MDDRVIIIGGGPAGLFCASLLLKKGRRVELYDQSSGVGKKFLVAGHGGLNLTHSEALDNFSKRYGKDEALFRELLEDYSPDDLREFLHSMGTETFIGTSGRVFPTRMKAGHILLRWIDDLKKHKSFSLKTKHRLIDLTKDGEATFISPDGEVRAKGKKIILAFGGASWPKTGSDGRWTTIMEKLGCEVAPLEPMNCGFEVDWSAYFKSKVDRFPLKNIKLTCGDKMSRAEALVTPYGIEGGGVYALSGALREEIKNKKWAKLIIDLRPDLAQEKIASKLEKKSGKVSWSNFFRKSLNLNKEHLLLIREVLSKEEFECSMTLARAIKHLEIKLLAPRPIEEAISSSGGVRFDSLDRFFQVKSASGIYVAGEMLDFEAPTGGYLLQACFSTAYRVCSHISEGN